MKGFLSVLVIFFTASQLSYGARGDFGYLNSASYTATNETTAFIDGTRPGSIFRRVVISTETGLNLIIYDSSAAASNQIAHIETSATPTTSTHIDFDVKLSSGLTYTSTGNTRGFTIIYELTHPR